MVHGQLASMLGSLWVRRPPPPCFPCFPARSSAVPVVHAVGGLRDTVKPFNPFENSGTGGGHDARMVALPACRPAGASVARWQVCTATGHLVCVRRRCLLPAPAHVPAWSPTPPRRACCDAGWTFEAADSGRFRNSLGDALLTYRQHRDSFTCAPVFEGASIGSLEDTPACRGGGASRPAHPPCLRALTAPPCLPPRPLPSLRTGPSSCVACSRTCLGSTRRRTTKTCWCRPSSRQARWFAAPL